MSFGIVVPVKPAGRAKTRLSPLGDDVRRELAVAFAADTLTAVLDCAAVSAVLVVTDDAMLAQDLRFPGVRVIPDGADDLNESITQASLELQRTHPGIRPAALLSDLPALQASELAAALMHAGDEVAFVADADAIGSTLAIGRAGEPLTTRFGPQSRQAHLDAGSKEIMLDLPTLRRDVDTADDLVRARELGVGARTAYVLTVHGL